MCRCRCVARLQTTIRTRSPKGRCGGAPRGHERTPPWTRRTAMPGKRPHAGAADIQPELLTGGRRRLHAPPVDGRRGVNAAVDPSGNAETLLCRRGQHVNLPPRTGASALDNVHVELQHTCRGVAIELCIVHMEVQMAYVGDARCAVFVIPDFTCCT